MAEDRTRVPDIKDLDGLPRTALTAFAARCARRVQPLFHDAWPDAPAEHLESFYRALTLAESFGESASSSDSAADDARTAHAAAASAHAAEAAAATGARAATPAAYAAAHASDSASDTLASPNAFAHAAADAAARAAAVSDISGVISASWRDLELLHAALKEEAWSSEKWPSKRGPSVPPEFFGPLWPDGEPERWPEAGLEEPAKDARLEFDLDFPPDATDEEIEKAVLELVRRVNAVHLAEGGRGLMVDTIRADARVPEVVKS